LGCLSEGVGGEDDRAEEVLEREFGMLHSRNGIETLSQETDNGASTGQSAQALIANESQLQEGVVWEGSRNRAVVGRVALLDGVGLHSPSPT
jgi:hypothetical protein